MHRKQNDTIIVQTFDLVNRILLSFSIKSHQYVKTMELLYVWIEDYKNIHHQGFNFSPKYRFEFKPTKYQDEANKNNVTEGELFQLDQNGDRISKESSTSNQDNSIYENFFEPSQEVKDAWKKREDELENSIHLGTITNISAIIGKNGAGKSNLLEFIKDKHRIDLKGKIGESYLFVVRIGLLKYYFKSGNIYIHTQNSVIDLNQAHIGFKEFPNFIFYSNQLSLHKRKDDYTKFKHNNSNILISVSLDSLFQNTETPIRLGEIQTLILLRKLLFIKDKPKILLPFHLPKKIKLNLIVDEVPSFMENNLRNSLYSEDIVQKWEVFFRQAVKIQLDESDKNFAYFAKIAFIQKIIHGFRENNFYSRNLGQIETFFRMLLADNDNILLRVEEFIQNFKEFPEYEEIISNFEDFLQAMYPSLSFSPIVKPALNEVDFLLQNARSIKFELEVDKDHMFNFLNAYNKLDWNLFDIEWTEPELSTGEDALLNIYANFYHTIRPGNAHSDSLNVMGKKIKSLDENYKLESLLILIDEGESGFHPEWQRKYLKYLIDFLPQIYPDKQIQIILTTHSPFLASDLPKENIIFLQKAEPKTEEEKKGNYEIVNGAKYENGKCVVVDGLKKDKTFGANIHTLLSDSFFLNEGLIGEFAKGKINEVIKIMGHELKKRNLNLRLENAKRLNLEKDIKNINEEIEELKQEKEKNKIKNFADEKDGIKKLIDIVGEPIVQDKLLQMYFSIESEDEKETQIKFHEEKIKRLKQL
jgi:energy-coupling factor transporter ATP-binding protein EcfA2